MNQTAQGSGLALYELLKESNEQQMAYPLLQELSEIVSDEEIRAYLEALNVSREDKQALLTKLLTQLNVSETFSKYVLAALKVLRYKVSLLKEVTKAYKEALYKDENILVAQVVSAEALTEATKEELIATLSKKYEAKIEGNFSVNPALISGIVIKVGDDTYNSSMKYQLEHLTYQLKKGVKESVS